MSYVFGIDLGGTKIALAAVSPNGEVLAESEMETRAHEGAPRVIARLIAALRALRPRGSLRGIGIGATGPLDLARGRIQNPYTLPTFDDVDIVTPLREEFRTTVVLENDCDAAALGEAWLGAGRAARNVVYITVGTGIGAGLILNGQLYRGVGLTAGELGQMSIDYRGPASYSGRGTLEALAAGPAIARAYMERTFTADLTARDVIDAARAGDSTARTVLREAAERLGVGVANLINLLAPDVIIFGGGVMERFELFAPVFYEILSERVVLVPWRQVRIRRAALGRRAGVIGAAKAVLDRISTQGGYS